MSDQIIPEKPDLFHQKTEKKPEPKTLPSPPPVRLIKPVKQRIRQEKPQEEKPVFNVPQTFQSEKMLVEPTIEVPKKKIGWKKRVIIAASIIIIVFGLGYYFLRG